MDDEVVPWISGSEIRLCLLARLCLESADESFAAAVDAAVEQSKPLLPTTDACITIPSFIDPLSEEEQTHLLSKLAENCRISSLELGFFVLDSVAIDFDAFQILANRVLTAFPSIKTLTIIEYFTHGIDAEMPVFSSSFLRPAGRSPFETIKLSLSTDWKRMTTLLLPLLVDCKHLELCGGTDDAVSGKPYLEKQFLSTLLSPAGSIRRLVMRDISVRDEKRGLVELAQALECVGCRLESLELRLKGNGLNMGGFMTAVGNNKRLKDLTVWFASSSWSTSNLTYLAAMLALNDRLEGLHIRASGGNELGILAVIAALGSNQTLKSLYLSGFTDFDDQCAVLLSKLLQRPGCRSRLRHVRLTHTSVDHRGALALAASSLLSNLDLLGTSIDGGTISAMVEQRNLLPNLTVLSGSIDIQAAMAIGTMIGRQSILVHNPDQQDMVRLIIGNILPRSTYSGTDIFINGCSVCHSGGARAVIELFKKHAQLSHIWFIDCLVSDLAKGDDLLELELYQTLNRKVPTELRQKMIDAAPLRPTEWCEALSTIVDESINCIYHLFSKWRLEGTSHHLFVSSKRKSASICGHDGPKKTRTA